MAYERKINIICDGFFGDTDDKQTDRCTSEIMTPCATVVEARQWAEDQGWDCKNLHDYCPECRERF